MGVVRRVGVGVLAGVVTGLVLGVLARLMMRLAALAAGAEVGFSLAGTASIVVVFVAFTVPGAVLASLVRRRGRSLLLVAAALFLCFPAASIASSDLGHVGGLSSVQWIGVGAAVAGVFAAILAIPWVALRLLRLRRLPQPPPVGLPA